MEFYIITLGRGIKLNPINIEELIQFHNNCNWPWKEDEVLIFDLIKEKQKIYQHNYISEADCYQAIQDSLSNKIDNSLKHGETCIFIAVNELDLDVIRMICKTKNNPDLILKILILDRYNNETKQYSYTTINVNSEGQFMDYLPHSFLETFINESVLETLLDWNK